VSKKPLPESRDWVRCRWCWWKVPRITRQRHANRSGYHLLAEHAADAHPAEYAEVNAAARAWAEQQGEALPDGEVNVPAYYEAVEALRWRQE
jgi:hypothetical protein